MYNLWLDAFQMLEQVENLNLTVQQKAMFISAKSSLSLFRDMAQTAGPDTEAVTKPVPKPLPPLPPSEAHGEVPSDKSAKARAPRSPAGFKCFCMKYNLKKDDPVNLETWNDLGPEEKKPFLEQATMVNSEINSKRKKKEEQQDDEKDVKKPKTVESVVEA